MSKNNNLKIGYFLNNVPLIRPSDLLATFLVHDIKHKIQLENNVVIFDTYRVLCWAEKVYYTMTKQYELSSIIDFNHQKKTK